MNVILISLVIMAAALGLANKVAGFFSVVLIFIFGCGQVVPKAPWKPNHYLHPKSQLFMAVLFYFGMIAFLLWTWIGGIVSYVYVDDFIEEYCQNCIEESCGCDDMCKDDENALKSLSYVSITFGIVIGTVISLTFARWTAVLGNHVVKDNADAANGIERMLNVVTLPNIDPCFCCCCPGVQGTCIYRPQKWGEAASDVASGVAGAAASVGDGIAGAAGDVADAAGDVKDATVSLCENLFPMICCCCFMTSYIIAGAICYGNTGGWFQVVCCIYFFICYLLIEIGGNSS